MQSLAKLLAQLGWQVSGSDCSLNLETVRRLRDFGVTAYAGHDARYVPSDAQCVIHSAAIRPENTEILRAKNRDCEVLSYPEMLGRISRSVETIAVAGTHGKTTTTAMTAWILNFAKKNFSSIFGAELQQPFSVSINTSHEAAASRLALVESCEYQKHFLNLRPKAAVITGMEEDHFDSYSTIDETIDAFSEFVRLIPDDGYLLIRKEDEGRLKPAVSDSENIETFTVDKKVDADWRAKKIEQSSTGVQFEIHYQNRLFSEIKLPAFGTHAVLNALAATAMANRYGVDAKTIERALATFPGVRRRFEELPEYCGVKRIDDYAHHPTAIRMTLKAVRTRFPNQFVRCVFQPHQVSRTLGLMKEFSEAFELVDDVIIAPIFAAREQPGAKTITVARQLSHQIALLGTSARFVPTLDRIASTLEDECRPGDVLVTLGAGDIDRVHYELTGRIQRHYAC